MSDDLRDVVASNVNEEAVVVFGVTAGELMSIAAICFATIMPLALIIGVWIGKITITFTVALPIIFGCVAAISVTMQGIKRGRPEGYFLHRMAFIQHTLGLKKSHIIRANGVMSTMRTKQCILIHKHLKQEFHDE